MDKKIKQLLKVLSAMDLAIRLQCSVTAIYTWRDGKSSPLKPYALKIDSLHKKLVLNDENNNSK